LVKTKKRRDKDAVNNGYKAVMMVSQLTNRVPELIEQSHLERKEGISLFPHVQAHFTKLIFHSLGNVLVSNLPNVPNPMSQPLSEDQAPSFLIHAKRTPLPQTSLNRPPRMDGYLQ